MTAQSEAFDGWRRAAQHEDLETEDIFRAGWHAFAEEMEKAMPEMPTGPSPSPYLQGFRDGANQTINVVSKRIAALKGE